MNDKKYEVVVYNNNGSKSYFTNDPNIFSAFDFGNATTVRFRTCDGWDISLPPNEVIIETREVINENN